MSYDRQCRSCGGFCGRGGCKVENVSMSKQPEALRLAGLIEHYNSGVHSQAIVEDYSKAADELRRLHEVNADLLEALKELADCGAEAWGEDRPCVRDARAAIAKARG